MEAVRKRWDASHTASETPTLGMIRRSTLSAALPHDVVNTTIWPSWPLEEIAAAVAAGHGQTLLDLGCGRGDIGLWLAAHTGASLVGVDPSPVGLAAASKAAAERGIAATFVEGHFTATGLDSNSVDAAVVVDAMHFAPRRVEALQEIARVLRPGGRLVIAGPERQEDSDPEDFGHAGLVVESRTETRDWREQMHAFVAALHEHELDLRDELGDELVDDLLGRPYADIIERAWHGLIVATLST